MKILFGASGASVLARAIVIALLLMVTHASMVYLTKPIAYLSIIPLLLGLYFFFGFRSNFVRKGRN